MSAKITEAGKATETTQEHVGRAVEILTRGFNGRSVNGFGVYADPTTRRAELRAAKEALDAALAIMTETTWPVAADYERA